MVISDHHGPREAGAGATWATAPPDTRALPAPPRRRARGWFFAVIVLLCVTATTVLDHAGSGSGPVRTSATVDAGVIAQTTTPWSIGLGSSTYGATVLSSAVQAENEEKLAAAKVRIPVAVRGGVVASGAVGGGDEPVLPLVQRYLQWGYRVLVVIDGQGDVPVRSADARAIISALGYGNGVEYSSSNEPDNQGHDLQDAIAQAQMILRQGRALHPGFRIWGPVWGSYDRDVLRQFAAALGSGLAGLDYHSYAMGQTSIPTSQALAATPALATEVRQTRADLTALGLTADVSVDELNLTWRFDDGTPGGDTRLLTAVNTVWLASACGHVMLAGGSCLPYADQNGPLGMLTEAGQVPLDRPASTPMPGYWGMAAWTGAGIFPHMGDAFVSAQASVPGIEIFAVRNADAGYNIVVIDKNEAPASTSFALGLKHIARGTYVAYATDPTLPYNAPVGGPVTRYGSTISLVVHAMSVTTFVLSPGR